jgi:hypothetical protein
LHSVRQRTDRARSDAYPGVSICPDMVRSRTDTAIRFFTTRERKAHEQHRLHRRLDRHRRRHLVVFWIALKRQRVPRTVPPPAKCLFARGNVNSNQRKRWLPQSAGVDSNRVAEQALSRPNREVLRHRGAPRRLVPAGSPMLLASCRPRPQVTSSGSATSTNGYDASYAAITGSNGDERATRNYADAG